MELRNRIYTKIIDAIERKDELFHPQIIEDLNENLSANLDRYSSYPIPHGIRNEGKIL